MDMKVSYLEKKKQVLRKLCGGSYARSELN